MKAPDAFVCVPIEGESDPDWVYGEPALARWLIVAQWYDAQGFIADVELLSTFDSESQAKAHIGMLRRTSAERIGA